VHVYAPCMCIKTILVHLYYVPNFFGCCSMICLMRILQKRKVLSLEWKNEGWWMMRVVSRWKRIKNWHSQDNVCVLAIKDGAWSVARSAAAADTREAATLVMVKTFRPLLHLQARSVCAVFFTARCYASAVLAMGLCLSVSVSVTSRSSIITAKRKITRTTPHDSPATL